MTESNYTRRIMRGLPTEIYKWKIMNSMQNGIPDCYFSGPAGDVWIEVKYTAVPSSDTRSRKINLSTLQRRWLQDRQAEGRKVAVLIGSDKGSHITLDMDKQSVMGKELTLTYDEVGQWITQQTLG